MKIGDREIDNKSRCYIIAELSANHGNDIEIAKKTIKAAKDCGADAIKLQTYTADTLTINCDKSYFKINTGTLWDGKTLYELYQEAYTPWEWQPELLEYSKSIGITCFSSPFDRTSVDFLEKLNVPAYKVASFEITDIDLIEYIASKGKPVIISTGIATSEEIENAISACKRMRNNEVILLKCTSQYPANVEDANLKTIPYLANRYKVISGLSDHSMDIEVPITAVALGAKVLEKHFILDRSIGGPDAEFSLTPNEFKAMVESIRKTESAMGIVDYELTDKKVKSRLFARSLFIVDDVKVGDTITKENIRSIRPGYGLPPKFLRDILGKTFRGNYEMGTPLKWEHINQ